MGVGSGARLRGAVMWLAMLAAPLHAQEAPGIISFEVIGVEPWVLDRIRANSLLSNADRDGVTDPQELMAAARSDYARILGTLYVEAHYSATISIRVDGQEAAYIPSLIAPPAIRSIEVVVVPGPVFDYREAAIAPLAPDTELPAGFLPQRRAHSTLIQTAVDAAAERWRELGHARVAVADQSIVADHPAERLDVNVRLDLGPQVRFGEFIVTGNERVRTARIHTIAGLPEGEVFSPADLDNAARRLRRTGAFSSVALVEAETLGPGDTMDITATVVEALPRRFGFGAELATDEGLTLTGYWMHRNLLGGAENLRFDAEITGIGGDLAGIGDRSGGTNYSLGVTYTRPATITPDTDLTASLLAQKKDENDYSSESIVFSTGLTHYFNDFMTGEIAVSYGRYRITDFLGTSNYEIISLPLGATYDRRNDRLNATGGYFLAADVEPYLGLGSTEPGTRLHLDARAYWSPIERGRFVLAGRAQAGTIFGPSLLEIPREFLFYSGGGGSVRGQPYQSLGVPYPGHPDQTIGGRSYLGLSGEIRGRITETWGAVAFYDAGYVGSDALFGDSGDWHAGAGLGVRYNTGIGPIRLDIAAPVSGSTGDGVQIYVGIGQSF